MENEFFEKKDFQFAAVVEFRIENLAFQIFWKRIKKKIFGQVFLNGLSSMLSLCFGAAV